MNQKRVAKKRSPYKSRSRNTPVERPTIDTRPEVLRSVNQSLEDATYIVFDIETTGGNPERNGITDIFAIKFSRGKIIDIFGTLVNPKIPIPPIVRRMTGITNSMLRNAPLIEDVMPQFVDFAEHGILVSHNTIGDMKFIRHFAEQTTGKVFDNFFLCTHLLVEKLFPETPDKTLSGLADYFEIASGDLHRAEADAYATLGLFEVLLQGLKKRLIERLDEAIRFQGDMESALRLGWAVPQSILDGLPHRPGVFKLLDSENNVMFVSCASDLHREIHRLRHSTQLPRQVLKMVLKTYNITVEETSSLFQAMLLESQDPSTKSTGSVIHNRQVMAFVITCDKASTYKISVDSLGAGLFLAYGPVRDRRTALELLDRLAECFGLSKSKSGLEVKHQELRLLQAFFEKNLNTLAAQIDKESKGLSLFFQPGKKRMLQAQKSVLGRLLTIDLPGKVQSLLGHSGVLAVRQPCKEQQWDVYGIEGSKPLVHKTFQGSIDDIPSSQVGKELFGIVQKAATNRPPSSIPLDQTNAKITNATLWWLLNLRGDGRFFSLEGS